MGKFYGCTTSRNILHLEKKMQIVADRKRKYENEKSDPYLRQSLNDVKKALRKQHIEIKGEFSFIGKNISEIGFARHNYRLNRDEILSPYGKSQKKWHCKNCNVYMYRKRDFKIFVVTLQNGKIVDEVFELSPRNKTTKLIKHNHSKDIHVLPSSYGIR